MKLFDLPVIVLSGLKSFRCLLLRRILPSRLRREAGDSELEVCGVSIKPLQTEISLRGSRLGDDGSLGTHQLDGNIEREAKLTLPGLLTENLC